jgi:hypothetical protein
MVILRRSAYLSHSQLAMHGIVHGLEPNFHGMWHFHRGFNCLAATEDIQYYEGIYAYYRTSRSQSAVHGGDDWTFGNYRADMRGVALLSQTFELSSPDLINVMSREMAGFQGQCGAWMPPTFYGRQMIVNGREGAYLGCGAISEFLPGVIEAIAAMTKYRLYDGPLNAGGLVDLKSTDDEVELTAVLTGLPTASSVVFRVHAGFECPGHDLVLTKLYPIAEQPDGQSIQTGDVLYSMPMLSDEFGNAFIHQTLGPPLRHVAGRVVIAATVDGVELACGTIEPTSAVVQAILPQQTLRGGLIIAAQASSGVALRGTLLFESEAQSGTIDITPSCSHSAQRLAQITFSAMAGAFQLTEHVLGASIDALGDSTPSLRNTSVKITSNDIDACAGYLSGPVSEVPTPRAGLCQIEIGLRYSERCFIVLGIVGLLLVLTLLGTLNFDSASQVAVACVSRRELPRGGSLLTSVRGSRTRSVSSQCSLSSGLESEKDISRVINNGEGEDVGMKVMAVTTLPMQATREAFQVPVTGASNQLTNEALSKPQLLALHGAASNSNVTRLQLKNLGIDESLFDIHCEKHQLRILLLI